MATARRTVPLLAASAACLVGFLTLLAWTGLDWPQTPLDRSIHSWALQFGGEGFPTAVMRLFTDLGGGTMACLVCAALALIIYRRSGRILVFPLVAVALIVQGLIVATVKNLGERPRPPLDGRLTVASGWSFPSGHSTVAAAGFGLCALLLVGTIAARRWQVVVIALAAVAIVGVGCSRVYLGVHWSTDVLAGWMLGLSVASLGAVAWALLPDALATVKAGRCDASEDANDQARRSAARGAVGD